MSYVRTMRKRSDRPSWWDNGTCYPHVVRVASAAKVICMQGLGQANKSVRHRWAGHTAHKMDSSPKSTHRGTLCECNGLCASLGRVGGGAKVQVRTAATGAAAGICGSLSHRQRRQEQSTRPRQTPSGVQWISERVRGGVAGLARNKKLQRWYARLHGSSGLGLPIDNQSSRNAYTNDTHDAQT